ncbi:MAG: hypothetical protein ABRQ27_11130 [Clostridiaceae bacterium]
MLISSRVERRSGMYKLIVEVDSIYNFRKDDIFWSENHVLPRI